MRSIAFHNRETEMKEIMRILNTEPTLITFIYGPINSGKTELINHLIKKLPEEYVVFYINLRTKFLASYDDFIESLFEMEIKETKKKETLKELVSSVTKAAGIPINREFLDYVFKDKKPKNAFSYIIKLFEEVKNAGKHPVLILDELQKIGDLKVNGLLIYELFNFFIDLTKEKHLAHVFVITSDSLFIEQVFNEAMLQERCRYLLVDDFDKSTAIKFLDKHKFSNTEKEVAWNYCGGKPVCLVELVNSEKREEKAKEMLRIRRGQINQRIELLKIVRKKILFEGEEIEIKYDDVIKILGKFSEDENYEYVGIMPDVTYLVKENILFVDPVKGIIKPQSRLNLLAIREILHKSDVNWIK
ncbi:MAG TPA: ATP-binding protein [Methanosarcinales archaeon]|nr:ATP-binding protein [Methanosarcinales archaeon]